MDPQIVEPGMSLLDLKDDELVRNRVRAFRLDLDYRDHEYGVDFKEAARLYGAGSGDTDEAGIPRVNLIRRAVEDHVSVATSNIPKARLVAERATLYAGEDSPIADRVRHRALDEAELTFNGMAESVLVDNDYVDLAEIAVRQSGIYGVGYLKIEPDRTADTRKSMELRDLWAKGPGNWTELDAMRFDAITRRIDVSHVNSPAVVWQGGVRRVGPDMLRVSIVEHKDTKSLQTIYKNPRIRPGRDVFTIDDDITDETSATAVLTTWELVPVIRTAILGREPEGDDEVALPEGAEDLLGKAVQVQITDWYLLKTVVAGGQLLERREWDSQSGPVMLPIIPWYMRESEEHPYGYSLPQSLELSERFINRVRTLIYQSALKSISPQAMVGYIPELGEGDVEAINAVLVKGGFANIKGNATNGPKDIREIVAPIITNNPGVSNALVQAMQHEEQAFQSQSASIDLNQIARAESGAAKRAQIAAFDRPKTITINLLSRSAEMVYDCIWEIIRTQYRKTNMPVSAIGRSGQREQAVLNQPYERTIPRLDPDGEPILGPDGMPQQEEIKLVLNDTTIVMKAEAEGRGKLPIDPVQRFMLLREYQVAGLIRSPQTMRDLVLDPAIISRDDDNFEKDLALMRKMQQGAGVQDGEQTLGIGNLSGAAPQTAGARPDLITGETSSDGSLAPTMAEMAGDATQ